MNGLAEKIASAITAGWAQRGLIAWLLLPLALVFGLLTALRRQLYRLGIFQSTVLPVPVIVIGNITVGGAGKTPLTIALVHALKAAGFQPGVVTRGYGGSHSQTSQPPAQADQTQAQIYGDEAVLIARTGAPVYVARDRAAAAQQLLTAHHAVDVILCDDGLQHYALQRDFEIAVFDARGISNGWLLPAGPLREPLRRLVDVQAVVLNGSAALAAAPQDVPVFHMQLRGHTAYALGAPEQSRDLSSFSNMKLLAAAGMGNPERFFQLLRSAGLRFDTLPLPDHYDFRFNPFVESRAEIILITEKDAVKCEALAHMRDLNLHEPRLWVVPVQATLDPALTERLVQFLQHSSKLEKHRGSSPA